MADNSRLEKLIIELKESFEREVQTLRTELLGRFDAQATRLDRLGADNRAGHSGGPG
jgi:hypothetical protein